MDFDSWMDEVENMLWVRLNSTPDDYDVDYAEMYDRGLDPDYVVYELYEDSDEDE